MKLGKIFFIHKKLGSQLKEAKVGDKVEIYGMIKEKKAEVLYSEEFSSHAKQEELLDFLNSFTNLRSVIINHGEVDVKEKICTKSL